MEYDSTIPRLHTWEMPPDLDTRSRWEQHNRKILKGERPKAVLVLEVKRKKFCGDVTNDGKKSPPSEIITKYLEVGLYSFDQTKKFQPTLRTLAIRELRNIYLKYSSSEYYLWRFEEKWHSCHGRLSGERFLDHLDQKAIYGVRGNSRFTRYGGIDLDWHKGDKSIFLEQLNILLDEFHGRDGWHYQVADQDAQGVHFLQVSPDTFEYDLYRSGLRARLQAIDRKHPHLANRAKDAGMKTLSDLEIFPNVINGLRLPFCIGRTMLLAGPLPKILLRGRQVVDVEKYIAWVNSPSAYMSREDVYAFITSRLVARQDSGKRVVTNNEKPSANPIAQPKPRDSESTSTIRHSIKHQYATAIIAFWSGNDAPQKSLNRQILLLANVAPFYYDRPESAVTAIEDMIEGLDDVEFSDRLSSGKRAEVSNVVKRNVKEAFSKSKSNPKLVATFEAWAKRGFNPFDKSTWANNVSGLKLGADFDWTPSDKSVLDQIQAILRTCEIQTAAFVKELVRIVAGHDGELAITFVERLLVKHGIKKGSNRDRKATKVMKLLRDHNWIVLLSECSWHPRQSDKSQSSGLARRYGLGEGLHHKLISGPNYQEEKIDMDILLQHQFGEYPTFTEQDRQELALEYARIKARISWY